MSDLAIAMVAFIAIAGATFVGLLLQKALPREHLSDASKDTVKVGMGMVATLAALVLGLLVGFATTSFTDLRADVRQTAATTVLLDRALAQSGLETKDVFWLAILFVSFALFAPRNATVLVTLLVCALSLSGSIFIILELNSPFGGAISISSAPLREAMDRLGQP